MGSGRDACQCDGRDPVAVIEILLRDAHRELEPVPKKGTFLATTSDGSSITLGAPDKLTGEAGGMGGDASLANTAVTGDPVAHEPLKRQGVRRRQERVSIRDRPQRSARSDALH